MKNNKRIGERKKRSIGSRANQPDLGYYFIITDTEETEQNYIKGLKDSIPQTLSRRLVIKVLKTSTVKLVQEALSRAASHPQYGEIWIIFDRDQVKNFDYIIKQAEMSGIKVGWSNPCIEIWFNSYFGKIPPYQTSVECCSKFSEKYLHETNQQYKKSDPKIYQNLCSYGNESKAIEIAEKRFLQYERDGITKPSDMCPCTTVYKLIKEIKSKIH